VEELVDELGEKSSYLCSHGASKYCPSALYHLLQGLVDSGGWKYEGEEDETSRPWLLRPLLSGGGKAGSAPEEPPKYGQEDSSMGQPGPLASRRVLVAPC
jgi:hypothetical protein